jgi:hypothetical protein
LHDHNTIKTEWWPRYSDHAFRAADHFLRHCRRCNFGMRLYCLMFNSQVESRFVIY